MLLSDDETMGTQWQSLVFIYFIGKDIDIGNIDVLQVYKHM